MKTVLEMIRYYYISLLVQNVTKFLFIHSKTYVLKFRC